MDANGIAGICRVCRQGMVREHGLQRSDGGRQIKTQKGHAILNLYKKCLGSACFARMECKIRRAAENMKPGVEFLSKNRLVLVMRNVGGAWICKQHRKRIVTDPMLSKKGTAINAGVLHEQVHTERATRTGAR